MAWRSLLSAILLLALAGPSLAQAPKVWRHGVIEPKSDAGFVMTASRRNFGDKFGLKLETLALKNGQIALKALLAATGPACRMRCSSNPTSPTCRGSRARRSPPLPLARYPTS